MVAAMLGAKTLSPVDAPRGAWVIAAARQRDGFDQVRDTIRALAAPGDRRPWVMTTALAVLGNATSPPRLGSRKLPQGAGRCLR